MKRLLLRRWRLETPEAPGILQNQLLYQAAQILPKIKADARRTVNLRYTWWSRLRKKGQPKSPVYQIIFLNKTQGCTATNISLRTLAYLRPLQERLDVVNASLREKESTKAEFDKTIGDTEKAYMKILESSQVLLNVVKKESAALNSAAEKKPTNNHRPC